MSTFWTPSGERPIPREEPGASPPAGRPPAGPGPGPDDMAGPGPGPDAMDADITDEEMEAELRAVQEQMLRAPAAVVVANHCIGLIELAALHLGQEPPRLADAQIAIDALAGVLDAIGTRLGENEAPLRQALHQMRMAFIEARSATGGSQPRG
jgi:hypothetical protein